MTVAEVEQLQRDMNRFTRRFLAKVAPIDTDGDRGQLTDGRIVECKFFLGFTGPSQRSKNVPPRFREQLDDPKSPKVLSAAMIKLGEERRREQRARARQPAPSGVTEFKGRKVAGWMVPYLEFAHENGWRGKLISGFRDPAHSEQICLSKCGHTSCPGTCAGRSSNHSGTAKPKGAIDVSDLDRFAELMRRCPLSPRIFNDLPSDRSHFSATGH